MKKVAVSLGHNPKSPGAVFDGYSEYTSLAPLFGYLISNLSLYNIEAYIVPTGELGNKTGWINNGNFDFAIELHMNADADMDEEDDPVGNGFEMLYYEGSVKGKIFADFVQRAIVNNFVTRDRGIKAKTQFAFLKDTNCPAVIAELGFIDSPDEAELVRRHAEYLASLIAFGIESAFLNLGD